MAREPQPTRQEVARQANPFADTPAGQVAARSNGLISVEQQRAIAEVQAMLIIARSSPRDPKLAWDRIQAECARVGLAEKAEYAYPRGGQLVSGPSIRLAEMIARNWGNISSGIKEISREDGYSECLAYAWDLETGYRDERVFRVKHWRDTKQGGYAVTDERDIYEVIANMGQRRKRACLLTIIPGDVVEMAEAECQSTLKAKADVSPQAMEKMLQKFAEHGVTKKHIEERIRRRFDAITPAHVVQLRRIYNSINDGVSQASDWFGASAVIRDAEVVETKDEGDKGSSSTASDVGGSQTASGAADRPKGQQQASRDTDERQQQPTADKFESYVVDHMGEAVGEGEIFSDPGQWIDAYHNLIDNAFPADTAAIIENNRETVAWLLAKMPGLSKTKQLTEDGSRPDKSDADRRPQAVEVPTRGQSQRDMKGYVEAVRKSVSAEIVDADSAAKWLARNEPIMSKLPPATRASAMQAYNARLDALGLGAGKAPEEDDSTAAQQQQQQTSGETAEQDHPDRRQFELWISDIGNVPSSNILDSYLSNKAYTAMLARFEREQPQFAESLKTAVDAKRSELQRLGR